MDQLMPRAAQPSKWIRDYESLRQVEIDALCDRFRGEGVVDVEDGC